MKKILKNLRNQKGSSNVEIIVFLTVVLMIGFALVLIPTNALKEAFSEMGTTQAEETVVAETEPLDVFSQMEKDVSDYQANAGYLTTVERQTMGYELLERLDILLEQAESAGNPEVVESILTHQLTVENEMNYGL